MKTRPFTIRAMKMEDYSRVRRLWKETEGLSLEESDSKEAIAVYLKRNRGFCFVACFGDLIVGTILCGHEGRRGFLRHLAVRKTYREKGIARRLIARGLSALAQAGIRKCNLFVLNTNVDGRGFWEHMGWYGLEDNFRMMQITTMKSLHESAKKR